MSHNDCNCMDTFSLLPHDVFISRCSTFHLPGTHTHEAYRAAIIRAELKSAVKYESIYEYHLIYTNVQGAGAKERENDTERESERGGEGDSRTAARFANKGKAQMEGNLLQMLIN